MDERRTHDLLDNPVKSNDGEWLKPKFVIPMHYGTTSVLKGTPQEYMAALGQTTKVFPINPGDRLEF